MRLGSRYPGISGSLESSNASSESTTGVPNKYYRGAQQGSPSGGRPLPQYSAQTSRKRAPLDLVIPHPQHTGVPNKHYRGAQQAVPGCPTSGSLQSCCKTGFFMSCFGGPLFLFLL